MRDQYAGDVTDVIKIAFLRALVSNDKTLGVGWYYAPGDDGRPDGRHLEWREEKAWRRLDPELFDALSTLTERRVAALEKLPIWPLGTLFHREPMPHRTLRSEWSAQMRSTLGTANLIFIDPDNGLGSHHEKHATYDDFRAMLAPERILVFISFPGKAAPYDVQVQELHERLKRETGTGVIFTLKTNVSVPRPSDPRYFVQRPRWFTVIHSDATLLARAHGFAEAFSSTIPRSKAQLVGDSCAQ